MVIIYFSLHLDPSALVNNDQAREATRKRVAEKARLDREKRAEESEQEEIKKRNQEMVRISSYIRQLSMICTVYF